MYEVNMSDSGTTHLQGLASIDSLRHHQTHMAGMDRHLPAMAQAMAVLSPQHKRLLLQELLILQGRTTQHQLVQITHRNMHNTTVEVKILMPLTEDTRIMWHIISTGNSSNSNKVNRIPMLRPLHRPTAKVRLLLLLHQADRPQVQVATIR